MKKIIFTVLASGLIFCACKRDKNNNPTPNNDTTTKVVPIPIVEIRFIKLYNQALDTAKQNGYNFYSISSQNSFNSKNGPIEIAFVHNQPANNSTKHLIGSATSAIVRSEHGVPNTNKTNIEFYKINNGSNTLIYDTISLSSSIETIFATKATKSDINGESNAIQSDGYGWDKDDILGFKLSNGKRGLILLTSKPTGSKDENSNIILGNIQFDIKMEK
ncbi:MAG: hypothetical protein NVV82_29115 [Sporocytophaga sp.]|nr:hypothetical protein [Sporocytophaga sp.]